MPARDITTTFEMDSAFNIQAIGSDTTTTGVILDTADYDGGVNIVIFSGTLVDGTYTPLLEEGDDSGLSDAAAVADNDMVKADPSSSDAPEVQATFAATDDNKAKKIGYVGSKRYIRLSLVSASTTSGGTIGALAMRKPEMTPATV